MRSIIATSALALAIAVPGLAAAQELKFSAGATLASQYVADGIEQTKGIAFQPWVEGEIGGFYFGAWLSNTDKAIVGSSSEIDLYVGYRGEVGMFSYDVGYTRYYYQNPKVDCCGDIIVQLGLAPTDKLSLGTKVKYNPSKSTNPTKAYNLSISADYALTDKFSMGAVYGKVTKGGMKYWSVGGSYAINDDLALGLSWNDTNTTKGVAVLALDYAFSFK
ncbi:MAG: TorF family putative porin [Rhodobacterales bacterium]|nr:TorF family putative porin [Rhodobacterales bacterium]MDX5501052.1 TorF family putative porin [Rhodobacterales bacterium]